MEVDGEATVESGADAGVAAEVREPRVPGLKHGVLHVGVVARLKVVHGGLPDTGGLLAAL